MMKHLASILSLFCFTSALAQQSEPEMADLMRSEGKIYVVVTIILIILAGLLVYLFTLDRKISRLEKESEKKG